MPRRNNPEDARCVQVSITVRPRDIHEFRRDAAALGVSLSRAIWLRAVNGRGDGQNQEQGRLQGIQTLEARQILSKIGNNLNQAVRLMHQEGAYSSSMAVESTLQAVAELQEQLRNIS